MIAAAWVSSDSGALYALAFLAAAPFAVAAWLWVAGDRSETRRKP